jgi:hypothetical protein
MINPTRKQIPKPTSDVWVSSDGRWQLITDMNDGHLYNTINMLRRTMRGWLERVDAAAMDIQKVVTESAEVSWADYAFMLDESRVTLKTTGNVLGAYFPLVTHAGDYTLDELVDEKLRQLCPAYGPLVEEAKRRGIDLDAATKEEALRAPTKVQNTARKFRDWQDSVRVPPFIGGV